MRHVLGNAKELFPIAGEERDRISLSRKACTQSLAVAWTHNHNHRNGEALTIVVHCIPSIATRATWLPSGVVASRRPVGGRQPSRPSTFVARNTNGHRSSQNDPGSTCFFGAYLLFTRLPSTFIPDEDQGALFLDIQLPTRHRSTALRRCWSTGGTVPLRTVVSTTTLLAPFVIFRYSELVFDVRLIMQSVRSRPPKFLLQAPN